MIFANDLGWCHCFERVHPGSLVHFLWYIELADKVSAEPKVQLIMGEPR